MKPERLFSDLFAFGRHSLAWVRIYRRGRGDAIALALNPVDNPGAGVVNDAEPLADALQGAFPALGNLRLLVHFPEDPSEEDWIEILRSKDGTEFSRCSREQLEALVGEELADPADASCAGLGGAEHPLLELVPPPEPEPNPLDDLAVVGVADLSWPHNPWKCHWSQRFQEISSFYPDDRIDRPAVGAHWFLTLSEDDLNACRYHRADWKRIAAVSVDVFQGLPQGSELEDATDAVDAMLGETEESGWCRSLFEDPIVWHPVQTIVTDGQHRSCALRASGAPLCLVDVRDGSVGEPAPADPGRRAAAELASFWAVRAAL